MCQYIAPLLVPPLRRCVFVALARWTHHPHSFHLACSLVQHTGRWICLQIRAVKDLAGASSREAVVDVPVNNQWHKKYRQPTGSRQVFKRKTRRQVFKRKTRRQVFAKHADKYSNAKHATYSSGGHVQQWGPRTAVGVTKVTRYSLKMLKFSTPKYRNSRFNV